MCRNFVPQEFFLHASKSTDMSLSHLSTLKCRRPYLRLARIENPQPGDRRQRYTNSPTRTIYLISKFSSEHYNEIMRSISKLQHSLIINSEMRTRVSEYNKNPNVMNEFFRFIVNERVLLTFVVSLDLEGNGRYDLMYRKVKCLDFTNKNRTSMWFDRTSEISVTAKRMEQYEELYETRNRQGDLLHRRQKKPY
ncbi:hypothetical protein ANN_12453 [Periplaneta americana]|uniref:Uncharacterized protein n=1 Tax=Periplaneta americana TaxID=6978 RepID=A0ABQ8TGJ6_PERAM|nr:hypothetical protein ANN_12453 [Periplaneta americana]